MSLNSLADLEAIIVERRQAAPDHSYTAKLFHNGQAYAAKKLGEEAVETVIAAIQGDREALINESADLLYHLLVVLQIGQINLSDVLSVLSARTQQSGLEEKAARLTQR